MTWIFASISLKASYSLTIRFINYETSWIHDSFSLFIQDPETVTADCLLGIESTVIKLAPLSSIKLFMAHSRDPSSPSLIIDDWITGFDTQ